MLVLVPLALVTPALALLDNTAVDTKTDIRPGIWDVKVQEVR